MTTTTITYMCNHSEITSIYVSDYEKKKYGSTEEKYEAKLIASALTYDCPDCSQVKARAYQRDIAEFAAKSQPVVVSNNTTQCANCGAPAEMNASIGLACADCYDDLSL